MVKNLPAMQKIQVRSLGQEDPLEKEMATHFSILTWTIPWADQLLSCVQLFVTPWTAACQASLSITHSWSLLKLMSITLVMPSNHLILLTEDET